MHLAHTYLQPRSKYLTKIIYGSISTMDAIRELAEIDTSDVKATVDRAKLAIGCQSLAKYVATSPEYFARTDTGRVPAISALARITACVLNMVEASLANRVRLANIESFIYRENNGTDQYPNPVRRYASYFRMVHRYTTNTLGPVSTLLVDTLKRFMCVYRHMYKLPPRCIRCAHVHSVGRSNTH